ncbi:MAG: hypothetical protein K2X37_00725, partial [Chitinophagaceae bacterium]|nr:hypothetical protein [Chitinophagaceae bacterium]
SCVPNIITGAVATGGSGSYVYSWQSSLDGGTTWTNIAGATSKDYLPTTIAVTTQYRRLVVSGECSTSISAAVSQNPTVTKSEAGADENICLDGSVFKLKGNVAITGSGKWTQISGAAGAVFADANQNDTQVSNLVGEQAYIFRWTIAKPDGSCPSIDDVTINTYSKSAGGTAVSPNPSTVCQGANSGTINITGALGDVLRWESSTDGTNWSTIANTTTSNSYLNINTTTRYRAVVQNGNCVLAYSTIFTVTVKPKPVVANAGPDQSLCSTTMITLNGNFAGADTGEWSVVSGPLVSITNANSNNAVVSGLVSGQSYVFRWTITGSPCVTTYDEVTIKVDEISENIITASKTTLCASSSAISINGSLPVISGGVSPEYTWQKSSNGLTWVNLLDDTQSLVVSPLVTTYYRRIVSSLTCANPSLAVKIEVIPALANNNITNASPICSGTKIVGTVPTGGTGFYNYTWQSSVDSGANWSLISGETGRDYLPTASGFYRRVVTSGDCVSATPGVAIVIKKMKAEYTFTKDVSCPNFTIDSSNIVVSHYPDNEVYTWYADGIVIGNGQTFPGYTIVEQNKDVVIKLQISNSLGCTFQEYSHTFSTKSATPKPVFTQNETISCGPATITFTNNTPNINSPTFKWTITEGANSQ